MSPSPRTAASRQRPLRPGQGLLGLALGTWAGVSLLAAGAPADAAPYRARTLVTGLENPRGLTIAPNGNLVLSEAGRGGSGPCILAGSGNTLCYGTTGAVGQFDRSTNVYSRALSNLPSLAVQSSPLFPEGTGLADLAFDGSGQLFGVFGFGANPNLIPAAGSPLFGKTVAIDLGAGSLTPLADIAAFEAAQNPDGKDLNSNPFALVVHGDDTYVTDSGGNSLVKADAANQVSLVNVFPEELVSTSHLPFPFPFPEVPAQAVPTGLTIGPDGALYITQLSGFPFAPGSADVFRYDFTNPVTKFASGFSNLIDIAAGPDDALYLLQYSDDFFGPPSGSILRLGLDGSVRTIFDDLVSPTGLAVGRDGTIYVANDGDGVNGQLLALTPVPTPGPLPLLGVGVAFAQARRLRRRCGGLSAARARRPAPPATASGGDRPSPGG
ncbi:ScyD/ScyE family protein [Cyanobium gracile UHCC 0139]|uniref:ScyD/ScyE family protein n=1 Tax=Cyanobium gracile UHCC 0139 TaxID=3110308 RepID=A0ABU5RQ49_9CYAN|nr:ScyD/ScyE family protein [Cyanobium gracile]MEA5389896.1 ScyD/ScyE family protein [Cyanobium gracile UHCC 0139]